MLKDVEVVRGVVSGSGVSPSIRPWPVPASPGSVSSRRGAALSRVPPVPPARGQASAPRVTRTSLPVSVRSLVKISV